MKRTGILTTVLTIALLVSSFGCGGAAIGSLTAINLTSGGGSTPNVKGTGGTLQLQASGTYSSTNTQDISSRVTYMVTATGTDFVLASLPTPPQGITISPAGLVTAVAPFICTWTDTTPGGTSPTWLLTGSYQVVAQYKGINSNPVFVSVASASGDGPGGQCGP